MKKKKTILEEAQEIIFERAQEKERDYGPIHDVMENTATMASIMTGKELTAEDCYKVMIALKQARMSRKFKRDTYLDMVAYTGALNDYMEIKTEGDDKEKL